jgi:hypothetical protein
VNIPVEDNWHIQCWSAKYRESVESLRVRIFSLHSNYIATPCPIHWTAVTPTACRHGPLRNWYLKPTAVKFHMCKIKCDCLLAGVEGFMGGIVCLEVVRMFPAITRRFTKATVWHSAIGLCVCVCVRTFVSDNNNAFLQKTISELYFELYTEVSNLQPREL